MNRHLKVLLSRVSGSCNPTEIQASLSYCNGELFPAVVLLLVAFCRENVAIGSFAREKGITSQTLAMNEVLWLQSPEGALAFRARHSTLVEMLQRFSEEDLLQARLVAQFILLHSEDHYRLVCTGQGHQPTETELTEGDAMKTRWSLRLLLVIYDVTRFQAELRKELERQSSLTS